MRRSSHPRRSARAGLLALLIACSVAGGFLGARADGASSGTVVGALVPSATSLLTTGCLPGVSGRTEFGMVLPGSTVLTTDDCTITFGSSNDTASLRIAQQDASGMAMSMAPERRQTSWATAGESVVTGVPWLNKGAGITSTLQPDGKLVVVGNTWPTWPGGADYRSVVYRLNADGTLDTAGFNAPNGYLLFDTAVGESESFSGVRLQPDGKIVAVGWTETGGTSRDATIARVLANGTPDLGFGGAGTGVRIEDLGVSTSTSEEGFVDLVVDASGTLTVLGISDPAGIETTWPVVRYLASGTPDPSIGGGTGTVTQNPTVNDDIAWTIAALPAGGYLIGGQGHPSLYEAYVGRIDASLALVTTWGGSGWRIHPNGTKYPRAIDFIPFADGSSLVAIEETTSTSGLAKVGKLTPAGDWDTVGFASPTGIAAINGGSTYNHTKAIQVDSIGRIYVLFSQQSTTGARIARLLSTGVLDTTFGSGGVTEQESALQQVMRRSLHLRGSSLLLSTAHGASDHDRTLRYGGPEVDDYVTGGGADRDWSSGTGTSTFGVCLRALGGSTPDWTIDADADCTAVDTDAWRAIPALVGSAAAKVGHTTASGATSTASLRFGFRPASNLAPGRYEAPLTIEVVAPQS